MANQTNGSEFWPLVPGALGADVLRPFAPLNAKTVAQAYELGFLNQSQLTDIVDMGLISTQSQYLTTLLKTASYIDRRRDISDELHRLASRGDDSAPPLWMLLARLIIQHYEDTDAALETLEQLYQWCDTPSALRPYTLFGRPNFSGVSRSRQIVGELDDVLRRSGV
jgi:hypothetical protein